MKSVFYYFIINLKQDEYWFIDGEIIIPGDKWIKYAPLMALDIKIKNDIIEFFSIRNILCYSRLGEEDKITFELRFC